VIHAPTLTELVATCLEVDRHAESIDELLAARREGVQERRADYFLLDRTTILEIETSRQDRLPRAIAQVEIFEKLRELPDAATPEQEHEFVRTELAPALHERRRMLARAFHDPIRKARCFSLASTRSELIAGLPEDAR